MCPLVTHLFFFINNIILLLDEVEAFQHFSRVMPKKMRLKLKNVTSPNTMLYGEQEYLQNTRIMLEVTHFVLRIL